VSKPLYESDPEAWRAYLAEGNAKQARKRVGVDALIRDTESRVLVVNPNYKPGWDLPGGMVEANEEPLDALRRELVEELALELPEYMLLCVDWVPPHGPWDDQLAFLFDGGTLPAETTLTLNDAELDEFSFVEQDRLGEMLRPRLWRRVQVGLDVIRTGGSSRYLQDGWPMDDIRSQRAAQRRAWARSSKGSTPPPGPPTGPSRPSGRPRQT